MQGKYAGSKSGSHVARAFRVLPPTNLERRTMTELTFHALPPLLAEQARRVAVEHGLAVTPAEDDGPFPVRCCLRDATAGEGVVLLSAQPVTAPSPYAAPGPIYLHRDSCDGYTANGEVPEMLRSRLLSVRGFDQ